MKKMFLVLIILFNFYGFADSSNYSIALGEKDQERLIILNEIYNPSTFKFIKDMNLNKGSKILELGCGIGKTSQALAEYVGEEGYVLGTDISEEQIAIAKSLSDQKNLEFRVLSATNLKGFEQQFDFVYARFLLTHLPDPLKVIQEVKKALKPGGKFIIEDIMEYSTLDSFPQVEGMANLKFLLKQLIELENGDYECMSYLPELLQSENFTIVSFEKSRPTYETQRKRKMFTYLASSVKSALLKTGRIGENQFEQIYHSIKKMEEDTSLEIQGFEFVQIQTLEFQEDTSLEIQGFEFGQICAQKSQ